MSESLHHLAVILDSINTHTDESSLPHPVSERLKNLKWKEEEIRYIDGLITKLKKILGCHKIWLYGSMARGDQDSNPDKQSDIDLAIEIDEGVYPNDMFRKDLKNTGFRDVQLNFFPIGFDESARDAVGEDDATYIYDDTDEVVRTVYKSDYVTRRISQDARKRLHDQIILWSRDENLDN
jgi:predicted nucleotidyltransferase